MFKKTILVSLISALVSTAVVPAASAVTESTPTKALVSTSWLQTNLKVIKGADHVFGAQHPWGHNEIPDLLMELCELSLKFILKMK